MIIINGESIEISDNTSIMDIVNQKGYRLQFIAAELNGNIVKKDSYSNTILKNGDKLEIVNFVGGG